MFLRTSEGVSKTGLSPCYLNVSMFSLWLQDFLEDDVQVLRDNRQEERRKKKKKSQQMQSKKSSNNNTELISGNCALC